MLSYDPAAPLVSLHIPKTGGSSLRDVLGTWFPDGRLLFHYREGQTPPPHHPLTGGICIHGHFNGARGIGAWHYYPQVRQHLTFLRDPFERFLSQWFYLNRRKTMGHFEPDLVDEPDFATWFHRRAEEQAAGRNSYSFLWQLAVPPGTEEPRAMLEGHFIFVGIMERYAASLQALARVLGQPPLPPPHVNVTPRTGDLSQWRGPYEARFPDECEMYAQALAANADAIAALR